jgi:hypothetical protein
MSKVEDHEGKQVYVINKKEYVELTWARDMQEAIERVRNLATEWSEYKYSSGDHIPHDCMAYEEAGELLLKALDGEK